MNGDEVAYNNQRHDLDHGGGLRPSAQSANGANEYRASYCVSCSTRLSRGTAITELKERFWSFGIIVASALGVLGTGVIYLYNHLGG